MKIEIYDPAPCCSPGAGGPSIDPELVRIQEVLLQIRKQAPQVEICRYGLAADPQAFADNATVAELLTNEGPQCLPLVFADGDLLTKGKYPVNGMLQAFLKEGGVEVSLPGKKKGCGCGAGCC